MAEITLQEQYINELFDPRSALSPREVAAREEIASLRAKLTGPAAEHLIAAVTGTQKPTVKKPAKVKNVAKDG